jgi:hypothetical protein
MRCAVLWSKHTCTSRLILEVIPGLGQVGSPHSSTNHATQIDMFVHLHQRAGLPDSSNVHPDVKHMCVNTMKCQVAPARPGGTSLTSLLAM